MDLNVPLVLATRPHESQLQPWLSTAVLDIYVSNLLLRMLIVESRIKHSEDYEGRVGDEGQPVAHCADARIRGAPSLRTSGCGSKCWLHFHQGFNAGTSGIQVGDCRSR